MADKTDVLSQNPFQNHTFIRAFIALYKDRRLLWNQSHPLYRNRAERKEAYDDLLQICREYQIDADEDFVRQKIESMRCSFMKERRKVLASREACQDPRDVYKPKLWYFNLLLFTTGEEPDMKTNPQSSANQEEENNDSKDLKPGPVRTYIWCQQYSAYLLSHYKKHPCLYDTTNPQYKNRLERMSAWRKIKEDLKLATGRTFSIDVIKRKISLLRSQYLFEFKKTKSNPNYRSTLWCYELLGFLKRHAHKNTRTTRQNDASSISKVEVKNEFPDNTTETNKENDIFDTIAKNVAHKLRSMNAGQRIIAERLIRDILYQGQMRYLTSDSKIIL